MQKTTEQHFTNKDIQIINKHMKRYFIPLLYGAQGEGRLARNLQGANRKLETHPRLLREGQPQPQEGLLCPLNLQ